MQNNSANTKLAVLKLKKSYVHSPESNLLFGIFSMSILDLADCHKYKKRIKNKDGKFSHVLEYYNPDYLSACRYLSNPPYYHAEIIGIDSDYVRRILSKIGLSFKTPNDA